MRSWLHSWLHREPLGLGEAIRRVHVFEGVEDGRLLFTDVHLAARGGYILGSFRAVSFDFLHLPL